MKGIKEAFIDAGEISQMLGIGMTKAYAIIKEYNAELEAKGYFTMRGKCPRKYFEQKIYGYEDYYNPDYEPQRNRSKVAEEMDYEAAVGDSVISEQDEVDIPPETNELSEDGAEIAENVMLDADVMVKETTELVNPASGGKKRPQNVQMGAESAPKTTKWGQKAPPHKSEPKKCGGKKCRQNAKVGAKSATKTVK
ncbi:hypothetical protein H8S51_016100 [Roseburia rectibacter]|uniref:hypothetical protein n=2 Tax=Lachnospiraceae TaxID=186803 RepID=UPI001F12F9D7|nr:hypothetical protein [Roseburia rectibacter]UMY99811.1 hypothetical protein H8S51_016100 [Roseburia rectibacter]